MLLAKADYWSYEDEWRIVLGSGYENLVPFDNQSLVGVTFGLRTPKEDKEEILSILRTRNSPVRVYEVSPDDNRFALKEKELMEINPATGLNMKE